MSTPNTLSYLIQFKTDLSVLDKTVGWLEKAQKRVQDYNAQMQNGTRAINAGLQAAMGLFAVGAMKGYVDEAIQMRKAQGQLDQALRKTGQYSAEYSKALAAQADAMEEATGVDSTRVQVVQRELTLAGVRKKDIAELTALTLDYAAAREIDAASAAKAVGQTLRGEGDSVRGLGVELDLSKGRVEGLKTAFAQFKGQAVEAVSALPPELRAFEKASGDAKKAAGQFLLEVSAPALEGFASGLKTTEEMLKRITAAGSPATSVLRSVSGAIGTFVGSHLGEIIALATGFLALKGGIYAVQQVSVTLGATWMMLTGQQFLPMIASIQALSREFGILRAATLTWQGALGTTALVLADFLVAFELGKWLGAFPDKQLAKIGATITDQTMAVLRQVDAAKTLQDIEAARKRVSDEQADNARQIAELEERKAKTEAPKDFSTRVLEWTYGPSDLSARFSKFDRERLEKLKIQRDQMAIVAAPLGDEAWVRKKIESAKSPEERSAEVLRAELVRKKEMLEIENQLIVATAARNQPEIDRLQRLIEEKKYTEDLKAFGAETAALVQSRLGAEANARDAVRKEQRDSFDLQLRQLEAELAGNRALQDKLKLEERERQLRIELQPQGAAAEAEIKRRLDLERQQLDRESQRYVVKAETTAAEAELARVEQARANITGSTLLDEATKRRRLTENTEEYRRVLAQVIELKLQDRKLSVDRAEQAALDAEIKRLRATASSYGLSDLQPSKIDAQRNSLRGMGIGANADGTPAEIDPAAHYRSTAEGVAGGVADFAIGLGTAGDNAAAAISGGLNSALSATSDIVNGLIWQSGNFREVWANATTALGQQFSRMATDMVTKMLWRATVERALVAMGVTTHIAGEQAKTAGTATGAAARIGMTIKEALASVYHGAIEAFKALAGIPYVGPFLAAGAMAAAVAGGIALVSKIAHFERGGLPAGGEQLIWINEGNKQEGILNAQATARVGAANIHRLNAGASLADLAGGATAALAARGAAVQSIPPIAAMIPTQAAAGSGNGGAEKRTTIIVDRRRSANAIARGSQAETDITEIGRENRYNTWRRRR